MSDQNKRAIGIFSEPQLVEDALNELKASGLDMDQVSVIAKQIENDTEYAGAHVSGQIGDKEIKGTTGLVKDTATTGMLGTFLVGLTGLVLPTVGPIIAAGSAAVALVATAASTGIEAASISNLVKALMDLGIPESDAKIYSDRLISGDPLIIVEGSDEKIQQAAGILEKRKIYHWGVYPVS